MTFYLKYVLPVNKLQKKNNLFWSKTHTAREKMNNFRNKSIKTA